MMGAMLILILVVPNLALKTCFIFIAGIMNAQLDVFLNMCIIEE